MFFEREENINNLEEFEKMPQKDHIDTLNMNLEIE